MPAFYTGKPRVPNSIRLVFFSVVVCACQTNISAEQEVVKDLPTNPSVSKNTLSLAQEITEPTAGDPRYSPVRDISLTSLQVPTGSLFHKSQYSGLFLQNRKYNVGDMVQVVLEEETKAFKRQGLSRDKEGELTIQPLELNAGFINVNRGDISLDHQQSSSFSSSSKSNQSNSLEGIVNVFVNEILQNGNLVVAGEKWIKLNEGDEYMRVYGELRTKDIQSNNTVSSTKLGNAQIEYSGKGKLQDNQQSSIISRILSIFQ